MACLVALQDPGLTVFPTHRLLTDLNDTPRQQALRDTLLRDWDVERIEIDDLEPPPGGEPRRSSATSTATTSRRSG